MCNRSSLIMATFSNGTPTFHFNLVRRVFSFSNNEKTLEMQTGLWTLLEMSKLF